MKKVIILSAAAIALVLGACNNSSSTKDEKTSAETTKSVVSNLDTTKLKTGDAFYQCPMHLEVMSGKPGSCSKCGMDLEKVVKQ